MKTPKFLILICMILVFFTYDIIFYSIYIFLINSNIIPKYLTDDINTFYLIISVIIFFVTILILFPYLYKMDKGNKKVLNNNENSKIKNIIKKFSETWIIASVILIIDWFVKEYRFFLDREINNWEQILLWIILFLWFIIVFGFFIN